MYLIKFLNFHSSNNHLHFITASQLQFISCTFFFSDKNFSNKYPCLLQNINVLYYIQTVPPTFLLYRSGAFSIGCVGGPGNSCLTVYKLLLVWPTYCDKKQSMMNSQCLVQNCDISDNFPLFPFFSSFVLFVFKPETMCSEFIEMKFCKMQESIFSLSFLCILFIVFSLGIFLSGSHTSWLWYIRCIKCRFHLVSFCDTNDMMFEIFWIILLFKIWHIFWNLLIIVVVKRKTIAVVFSLLVRSSFFSF